MNPANRLTVNRARKIHNDQKPRRLDLNTSQRRRCSAENQGLTFGSPPAVNCSTMAVSVGASMVSHFARLEIDAWTAPRIGEVRKQIDEEAHQREDVDRGEHDRIVA